MKSKVLTNGLVKLLMIAFLFAGMQSLFAQDELDDEMDSGEEVVCTPSNFETPYEKFQSDTIPQKQIQIWYSFGQEEFKHEQYKKSIPYYWKVLVNDKVGTYKVVYSKLAKAYFELTKTDEANKTTYLDSTLLIIYRGLEKHPDYVSLHYRAGNLQRTLGRPTCAVPHYEALVASKPEEKSYLSTLAKLFFQMEDERSLELQEKVTELDPSDTKASKDLLSMYNFFGKDPMELMESQYTKNPEDPKVAFAFGKEAVTVGEFEKAIPALQNTIKADAKHVDAMRYMAQAYEGLSQYSDAVTQYKTILNLDPKNVDVLCSIASAYISLNQYGSAFKHLSQAKRIDPNNGLPYMVTAFAYENAISYCSNKRSSRELIYDDKLAYERAAGQYRQAAKDPKYKGQANERYNQLRDNGFFRNKEEKFMKNNRENIADACLKGIIG
ncbi:MAG: tetratricopeptide repeat protein [Calditrichia bacterium]